MGTQVPPTSARVVLVDVRHDRQAVLRVMVEACLGLGAVVAETSTPSEASEAIERCQADVALIEIQMPLSEGLAAVASLRADHPALLIVVCMFNRGAELQRLCLEAGADAFLPKPVSALDLRTVIRAGHRAPVPVS